MQSLTNHTNTFTNMKKRFLYLLTCAAIIACTMLTACEETIGYKNLVGTWSGHNEQQSITITFEINHEFEMQLTDQQTQKTQYWEGYYTCTSTTFVLHADELNDYHEDAKWAYDYTISANGEDMTITDIYGTTTNMKKY